MVKIRLTRTGKKGSPSYKIVVTEHSRAAKGGKYIEAIGAFNPCENPEVLKVDKERLAYWLSVGAQPTKTVENLVKKV